MDNILSIIYEYSTKHKILDSKMIEYIMNQLIISMNIVNIKDIEYLHSLFNAKFQGAYSRELEKIYINLPSIKINSILFDNGKLNTLFIDSNYTIDEVYFNINLNIVKVLLHEICHARQFIRIENDDIETRIIKLEDEYFKEICDHNYKALLQNYYSNYQYSPIERYANIDALEEIYNMSTTLGLNHISEHRRNILEKIKFKGYIDQKGPTTTFFENISLIDNYNQILESEDIPFDLKYRLGLNINKSEYAALKRTL